MYFGNERQHSSLKCHMSTPPPKPVVGAQGREKVIKIVWDAGGKDKDPPPPHPFQTLVVRDRGENNPIIKQHWHWIGIWESLHACITLPIHFPIHIPHSNT